MASEVDICNLALGNLGDIANVSSIDPPEGSAQAQLCAQFYPIARDSLLEMHTWGFCTMRANLPLLQDLSGQQTQWQYIYQAPSNVLNYIAVLDQNAMDDYSQQFPMAYTQVGLVNNGQGLYTPQDFVVESLVDGTQVIYTNQDNAMLRYTAKVTDPTKFTPLFVEALSHYLSAKLAGPLLKGDQGAAEAKRQMQLFQLHMEKAVESDSNQRRLQVKQSTPWMAAR